MKISIEMNYGLYLDCEFVRKNSQIKVLRTSFMGVEVNIEEWEMEQLQDDILDKLNDGLEIV